MKKSTTRKRKRTPVEAFVSLSPQEQEAAYKAVDREFSPAELRPLNAAERKLWEKARKRPQGRPQVGRGVKVIALSVERGLLERADAYAARLGLSRAQLVAKSLEKAMSAE